MEGLPNKRTSEILNILLNSQTPITVDTLASKLMVSNRTIRNDLNAIEEYVTLNKCGNLVKKPRVGVWIEGSKDERARLRERVSQNSIYIKHFSSEQRKLIIIKKLLQYEDGILIETLVSELKVSRVTIYKDLKDVENWLSAYNLSISRQKGNGIKVAGGESDWRRAAVDLLSMFKDNLELKSMLLELDNIDPTNYMESESYTQLNELFPHINIRAINLILNEVNKKIEYKVAAEVLEGLLVHIAITIERLRKHKNIKMVAEQLSVIKEEKEFNIAENIAKKIEKEFQISIPDSEIGYIALHLSGSKAVQKYEAVEGKKIIDAAEDKIIVLAKDIISLVGSILDVNIEGDKRLLIGLVLHLKPTINRLKYGLGVKNPMLKSIKNNYPSIFGASWASSVLFEKHLGIKVNEDEIGYIAIHIGAALKRLKE